MNHIGQITCNGETFQKWASDPQYEILSVETPKPGIYRFTPTLRNNSLSPEKEHHLEKSGIDTLSVRATPNGAAKVSGNTNAADNLFGDASPKTPPGVACPQDDPPKSPIPTGTLSKRIELLPADIPDFLLRSKRLEIVITGQMPHSDGRHTIFEYTEVQNAPKVNVERLQAIPERLVMTCQYCQGPLEEDGTCNICAVGDRIFAKSRANRKAYHEQKKAGL